MKTPAASAWIPGLVLAMVWLPGGLAQHETNRPAPLAPDPTPIATPSPAAPAPVIPEITAPKDFPSLAKPPSDSDVPVSKRQPPKIRLSPWTSEIVKLAESGIEDGVILSFIENAGTFNLGADQIVYLNDLGLSSGIITVMLRHDQEIISGLRPLTIASEPDWLSAFDQPFNTSNEVSHKTSVPLSTAPVLPRPTPTEMLNPPGPETLPEVNRSFPTTQLATIQDGILDELAPIRPSVFSQQTQLSEKKSILYRVREPFPEEITAPIILISESRTPNRMIVVGFPRTTP
jgi:hypothetical protein